jgi:hypothetical protein
VAPAKGTLLVGVIAFAQQVCVEELKLTLKLNNWAFAYETVM